jgi:hypothetical protein
MDWVHCQKFITISIYHSMCELGWQ